MLVLAVAALTQIDGIDQYVMTNQCRLAGIDIDGFFGDDTGRRVGAIQKWNGLDQTGRCDTAT